MPASLLDDHNLQARDDWQALPSPERGSRRPGLRSYLAGILLIALLPALLAGGLAVASPAGASRRAFESRLRDTARALSLAVDADIKGRIEALTAFATSGAF